MRRASLLLLALPLAGCAEPACEPFVYPKLTLSEAELAFPASVLGERVERTVIVSNEGGYPMGVRAIGIEDGARAEDFDVTWDACAIECDGDAKAADVDTGGPGDTGPGDTDDTDAEPAPCAGPDGTLFVLDPTCRIAVTVGYAGETPGELYNALVVESASGPVPSYEPDAEPPLPAYLADPIHRFAVTWLQGTAPSVETGGYPILDPFTLDFGFVYPGETRTGSVDIRNGGTGALEVGSAGLTSCGPEFTLVSAPTGGEVLAPGESLPVEIAYAPTSTTAAYCQLRVAAGPYTQDATIVGNLATAPNTAPTVTITSPGAGTAVSSGGTLTLGLTVTDPDQPISTLTCRVQSVVQGAGTVATCTPPDDTGVYTVDIPGSALVAGVDTLRVTVVDALAAGGSATVSIAVDTAPTGDADGDGFTAAIDCDDASAATYPEATEVDDGADNDCDGVVDENTTGFDDDGDGMSESAGDCDDTDVSVYTGASERGDGQDNDCDTIVDENTSLYDDDGDGFADVNNDCDDNDPAVHPGATELCDGVDNDCDGLRDTADDCVEETTVLYAVGDLVLPEQTAILEGETIALEARVVAADDAAVTYAWSSDDPDAIGDATSPSATFTGTETEAARTENVYLVINDGTGEDWVFADVTIYPPGTDLYDLCLATEEADACGCGGGGGAAVLLLAAGALVRRRRR